MATTTETYEQARQAWQPRPDDNPDPSSQAFYRAFAGFDAVCIAQGIDPHTYSMLFHNATIAGHEWRDLVAQMRHDTPADPARPVQHYSYDPEPCRSDRYARDAFVSQFKARYPGTSLNSKLAHEKWAGCREQAEKLADEDYARRLNTWQERQDKRAAEHAATIATWETKCANLAAMRTFVASLI